MKRRLIIIETTVDEYDTMDAKVVNEAIQNVLRRRIQIEILTEREEINFVKVVEV